MTERYSDARLKYTTHKKTALTCSAVFLISYYEVTNFSFGLVGGMNLLHDCCSVD